MGFKQIRINIKQGIMQQLATSIRSRIARMKGTVQSVLSQQQMRSLKQEEKLRCQKQNFIISMMRSSKVLTPHLKKTYYLQSIQLMKQLAPEFVIPQSQMTEDSFLNDFVGLYTLFFNSFEGKLVFKISIKSFLRPTNHNLVVDLIKYLADFTRDYYAQTLLWKVKQGDVRLTKVTEDIGIKLLKGTLPKQTVKEQIARQLHSRVRQDSQYSSATKSIEDKGKSSKQYGEGFKVREKNFNPNKLNRGGSLSRNKVQDSISRHSTRANQSEVHQEIGKKSEPANLIKNELVGVKEGHDIYDIMDIAVLPQVKTLNKDCPNIEISKTKLNDWFRDQKSRNLSIKQSYQAYCSLYQESKKTKPTLSNKEKNNVDLIAQAILPWRVILTIQKNGFAALNLEFEVKKLKNTIQNNGSTKFASLSNITQNSKSNEGQMMLPFKSSHMLNEVNQSPRRKQPILMSMKILRASENFLPFLTKPVKPAKPQQENTHGQGMIWDAQSRGRKQSDQFAAIRKPNKGTGQFRPSSQSKVEKIVISIQNKTQSFASSVHGQRQSTKRELMEKLPRCFETIRKSNYLNEEVITVSKKVKESKMLTSFKVRNQKDAERRVNLPGYINAKEQVRHDKSYKNSQQGRNGKNVHNGNKNGSQTGKDSQQKILEWLQKIKSLKEMERRKILGME